MLQSQHDSFCHANDDDDDVDDDDDDDGDDDDDDGVIRVSIIRISMAK